MGSSEMSFNAVKHQEMPSILPVKNSELIYHIEDRPPLTQTLLAAFQHLLAMFFGIITPPLLICRALGLSEQDTQLIISMSLFTSGLASIIQIKTWGPIGSGLLSMQGTSFNFVLPLILGGTALKTAGMDTPTMMASLFGTLMVASCIEMLISCVLDLANRVITPIVTGVVVMIIGLSLIQVGLTSVGGGYTAMINNTFGSPKNLLLAGVVLISIILLHLQKIPFLRVTSVIISVILGYLLAWAMGMLEENKIFHNDILIVFPKPFYYGIGIDWNLLVNLMLVFAMTSLETIGDITATSDISGQPIFGPLYIKRLKGGLLANGLNSCISAIFNTFPNSCFGQNNSIIQVTGVASRYVGFVVALMLIALGLFPVISNFMQRIPEPVLGGATLIMFGTIAASGVRILSKETLNRRTIMIVALSLSVGLGISQQPMILQFTPEWIKNLLSSGVAAGGITAIMLNHIFPPETTDPS